METSIRAEVHFHPATRFISFLRYVHSFIRRSKRRHIANIPAGLSLASTPVLHANCNSTLLFSILAQQMPQPSPYMAVISVASPTSIALIINCVAQPALLQDAASHWHSSILRSLAGAISYFSRILWSI